MRNFSYIYLKFHSRQVIASLAPRISGWKTLYAKNADDLSSDNYDKLKIKIIISLLTLLLSRLSFGQVQYTLTWVRDTVETHKILVTKTKGAVDFDKFVIHKLSKKQIK